MVEKLSIPKISKDPKVKRLLHQLDTNGDGYIERKEVDENGDGYLDCNRVTGNWLYPKFGPVKKALFDSGLISKLKGAVCRPVESKAPWQKKPDKPYQPSPQSPYYREEKQVDAAIKGGQTRHADWSRPL